MIGPTPAELERTTGFDVLDHLDREVTIPALRGLQLQGDVAVAPTRNPAPTDPSPVPRCGTLIVAGDNGHEHRLFGEGSVMWAETPRRQLAVGVVTVPDGSIGVLAHPEHGFLRIAPGSYELRRQREQADEERLVAD